MTDEIELLGSVSHCGPQPSLSLKLFLSRLETAGANARETELND